MSEPEIVHQDVDITSYVITHPKHGEARCDDRMLPEFLAAGWKKAKATAPAADKP